MHTGWLCAAAAALTLAPWAAAHATISDAALQRSEQLDTRRIGKLSDDERSVLRIEWRSTLSGEEETRSVQEMLLSLRRMEATVAEIGRLIRSIPEQRAPAAPSTTEAVEAGDHDSRWALVISALVVFLALWWSRRSDSAKHAAASHAALPETTPAARPIDEPVAAPPSAAAQPAAVPHGAVSRNPPGATAITAKAAPAAPAPTVTAEPAPAAPAAEDDSPIIEFSLEEADPEAVAQANARVPQPAAKRPRPPRKPQDPNVDPTMELAEIMLSLGLEQGAAQALVEYTEANPRQALYHWLKLLDIYRNSGNQQEFQEAAEKLRRHFNIQAEDWAKAHPGEAPTLENFSRISAQVQETWSRPEECSAYLRHLLEDNRDGARAGFPRAVAEEILMLIEVLKTSSGQVGAA